MDHVFSIGFALVALVALAAIVGLVGLVALVGLGALVAWVMCIQGRANTFAQDSQI